MKTLKILLSLSAIVLTTTASQAINFQDRDCVHSYTIMNKFVGKVLENEKLHNNTISMKIHSDLAKEHSTYTVNDCKYVRPELSQIAQENHDELVAIDEAVKYAEIVAELKEVIKDNT